MSDLRTALWDDNPVDITSEANFIWSIANKLRGSYMPDKYGDMYNQRLIQCPAYRSVEKWLK